MHHHKKKKLKKIEQEEKYKKKLQQKELYDLSIPINLDGVIVLDPACTDTYRALREIDVRNNYASFRDFGSWFEFSIHYPKLNLHRVLSSKESGTNFLKKVKEHSKKICTLVNDTRERMITIFHENFYLNYKNEFSIEVDPELAKLEIDVFLRYKNSNRGICINFSDMSQTCFYDSEDKKILYRNNLDNVFLGIFLANEDIYFCKNFLNLNSEQLKQQLQRLMYEYRTSGIAA